MKHQKQPSFTTRIVAGFVVAFVTTVASAGLPEPGVLLYGQVLDDSGALVTVGELSWTFTSDSAEDPFVISTQLRSIDGPGGPYSYQILIPLETEIAGFELSTRALAASSSPITYARDVELINANISMSHTISLSRADRGTIARVDVCNTCDAFTKLFHSADTNGDLKFSLGEFLRVLELHTATESHDYHADHDGEDGFAVGFGPHEGFPHSSDFDGVPDWKISLSEVLRMIDLFTSTPDHEYFPDPLGDDGFSKGVRGGTEKLLFAKSSIAPSLQATLQIYPTARADISRITLDADGFLGDDISAFGISLAMPDGWILNSVSNSSGAAISSQSGDTDRLDFAWMSAPAVPFNITFSVSHPANADLTRDFAQMTGQALFRTVTGSGETKMTFGASQEQEILIVASNGGGGSGDGSATTGEISVTGSEDPSIDDDSGNDGGTIGDGTINVQEGDTETGDDDIETSTRRHGRSAGREFDFRVGQPEQRGAPPLPAQNAFTLILVSILLGALGVFWAMRRMKT